MRILVATVSPCTVYGLLDLHSIPIIVLFISVSYCCAKHDRSFTHLPLYPKSYSSFTQQPLSLNSHSPFSAIALTFSLKSHSLLLNCRSAITPIETIAPDT